MGVGTSDTPETDAVRHAGADEPAGRRAEHLTGGTEAAIPPEAFVTAELDETSRVVRVRVRATLPARRRPSARCARPACSRAMATPRSSTTA